MNEIWLYNLLDTSGYKIYPLVAPDNEKMPFVVYQPTASLKEFGLTSHLDKIKTRFNVSIYADSYPEVKTITSEIETILYTEIESIYNTSETVEDDYFRTTIDLSVYK